MLKSSKQALATLHLTRLSVAIGAVADIWLVLMLTKSDSDFVGTSVYAIPWWSALLATGVVAVDLDFQSIHQGSANTMLMISANGTAVICI